MKQELTRLFLLIDFLIKKKSNIIIISHVGRPKGKVNKTYSLKPICENLEKKIKKKLSFLMIIFLR